MGERPRKRRWPWILGVLALLLAAGAWWVQRALEPDRLTAMVLEKLGADLGLELSIAGTPAYALRPEPRLVLPNLVARQPGAAGPLLRAEQVEVSLPWSTITGDGPLVITRLELRRPQLDLAALAAWQATRPETPFELPTFTDGLQVVDGTVLGDGWALDMLGLELPELRPGEAVDARVSGQFERGTTFVLFEGPVALRSAGLASAFETRLQGRLRDGELDVPVTVDAKGDFDASGEPLELTLADFDLASESPLPDFQAEGWLRSGETLAAQLRGELTSWPADWPALPAPLDGEAPLPFTLGYEGAADLSAPMALTLAPAGARLEAEVALLELLAWMDAAPTSPLPPLSGELTAETLVVEGFTLEGVRATLGDDGDDGADPASDERP